jgi:DNA polymerase-4
VKSVLFIDPPAFCATVERLVAPALRSRPVAVAPPGADRATVLALSPEAQAAGITRGMGVRHAKKLCPDLILLPPNPRLYARASRALYEILRVYAPVIEPRGYGHAFLDISGTEGLFGPAVDVADRIRREAAARLRLPLTVGAAGNKLVSEAATRVGRDSSLPSYRLTAFPPDIWPMLVAHGSEASFLAPHQIGVLPGVPEDIRFRLDEYQLERIGQVAAIAESELCAVFGARGRLLRAQSRGIDARPVLSPAVKAEYRLTHTLATDTNDLGVLHPLLRRITEALGRRLRQRALAARRLAVQVEYADYHRSAKRISLAAYCLDRDLWNAARRGLDAAMGRRTAVRTVTVTADLLVEANAQLDLWEAAETPADALQSARDRIHRRWGERSSYQTRTILPTESFRSMVSCAATMSAMGNTA